MLFYQPQTLAYRFVVVQVHAVQWLHVRTGNHDNLIGRCTRLRCKDSSSLLAIHRFLFQDVYVRAGELRTVNISKKGRRKIRHRIQVR